MNDKEMFSIEKEVKEIFITTMDVIEECLSEALEKIEGLEYNAC